MSLTSSFTKSFTNLPSHFPLENDFYGKDITLNFFSLRSNISPFVIIASIISSLFRRGTATPNSSLVYLSILTAKSVFTISLTSLKIRVNAASIFLLSGKVVGSTPALTNSNHSKSSTPIFYIINDYSLNSKSKFT